MNRNETVDRFRQRLLEVIRRSGLSRSAFAERVGIDRSTLSQILSASTNRLPRVETLTAIATSEQVSLDWLVGLTEQGALSANLVPALEITPGGTSPTDENLERWRAEALGRKIRHVPTTLPDVLKTDEVIEYEYREAASATPEQRIEATQSGLAYHRQFEADTEVCTARHFVEGFARGDGLWQRLAPAARRRQLEHFATLLDDLYPAYRWFLFDALRRFSIPLTIFGPQRAVIYVGQAYMVFNSREHIRALTRHFDDLVREAVVQAPEVPVFLRRLAAEL